MTPIPGSGQAVGTVGRIYFARVLGDAAEHEYPAAADERHPPADVGKRLFGGAGPVDVQEVERREGRDAEPRARLIEAAPPA